MMQVQDAFVVVQALGERVCQNLPVLLIGAVGQADVVAGVEPNIGFEFADHPASPPAVT
jgi:hypothetical protein